MVDIDFLSQLVDSMYDATERLEIAVKKNKKDEANKLKVFIFDLHRQIESIIGGGNV
jgi:hypothetical protein